MIIAEIGQNHNGDMHLARHLIALAKEGGADLAKFQLYNTDDLYERGTELYNFARQAELTKEQAQELFNYGREIGIEVFFSVFDTERVRWCEEIGVGRYKIAKSQNRNKQLLNRVWATNKPTIISGRGNTESPFQNSPNASFLHCISKYPARLTDLDFKSVFYGKAFDGFSDHTIGLDAAKIALARGAKIIEKHFTLDKNADGPDHIHSMTPIELEELVRFSKAVKEAL